MPLYIQKKMFVFIKKIMHLFNFYVNISNRNNTATTQLRNYSNDGICCNFHISIFIYIFLIICIKQITNSNIIKTTVSCIMLFI